MDLLPARILSNVRIAVSVSPSADLPRLGLIEDHFRLALGEIARTVLVLGGKLQYCGHLEPEGYTVFLMGELKRYARRDEPLSVVLSWSVHRRLSLIQLQEAREQLGLFGFITCLDAAGNKIDCLADRDEAPPGVPDDEIAPSLTAMRQHAVEHAKGRVFIGGRRSGYQGIMPGVVEEALIAIEASHPIFLAGGFGGVTLDLVRQVDPEATSWFPSVSSNELDSGCQTGLRKFGDAVAGRRWGALKNGLDDAENTRLAATHRPSEVAALISLGLGRLARADAFGP